MKLKLRLKTSFKTLLFSQNLLIMSTRLYSHTLRPFHVVLLSFKSYFQFLPFLVFHTVVCPLAFSIICTFCSVLYCNSLTTVYLSTCYIIGFVFYRSLNWLAVLSLRKVNTCRIVTVIGKWFTLSNGEIFAVTEQKFFFMKVTFYFFTRVTFRC